MTDKRPIGTYTKFKIRPDALDDFKRCVRRLLDHTRAEQPGTIRSDWFVGDDIAECIAMHRFRDSFSYASYIENTGECYKEFGRLAEMSMEFLGPEAPANVPSGMTAMFFHYDQGLENEPDSLPEDAVFPEGTVEILTKFEIKDGELADFKAESGNMIDIVRSRDPDTCRYDWFYNEETNAGRARDVYGSPEGIFTHMKNCKAVHDRLLSHTFGMVNEFLGELPPAVLEVVSKYDTYILPFFAGLRNQSSGRYY